MKVKELIEKLSQFDENLKVVFSYDYNDRCHTIVAKEVDTVQTEGVYHSEYHRSLAVRRTDEDGDLCIEDGDEEVCCIS